MLPNKNDVILIIEFLPQNYEYCYISELCLCINHLSKQKKHAHVPFIYSKQKHRVKLFLNMKNSATITCKLSKIQDKQHCTNPNNN